MKILVLLITFTFISCGNDNIQLKKSTQNTEYFKSTELEMFNLINKHRATLGLSLLIPLLEATEQSQSHSNYMAYTLRGLTHNGFSQRINDIREDTNTRITRSAENVAYNSSTLRAHNALLNSPGHRKNIEGDYTHFGIGEVTDSNGRMYFTQIFVKIIK
jgi:uncharacterized protein YkwD